MECEEIVDANSAINGMKSSGVSAGCLRRALPIISFGLGCVALMLLAPIVSCASPQDSTQTDPLFLSKPSYDELKVRAEELARKAAEDSTSYDVHFELAGIYYDMGSLVQSVKHYEIAAKLDQTSTKVLVNLGVVLNEMGKSEEAIEAYNKALEIDPNETKALCNRGLAYYAVGDYAGAVEQYRLALKIDPNSLEAHYNLGVAFADSEIYREAMAEWNKVVELAPDSDAARAAMANIEVIQQLIELKEQEKK